ncbi:uncharacterized protein JN550_012342 [Neoarthrinium moseri]|uniref:uncharacterized protein n=1 Tax=Neoarthrinium moseri TaxID=1658444 RepID=UPI001FDE7C93|nr:uncharacterized protein JN550_012342 [Neoarthrinium moseri]KAI1858883.1 hypothetical protein JN550_012342 [Neoarthrinium moseri]
MLMKPVAGNLYQLKCTLGIDLGYLIDSTCTSMLQALDYLATNDLVHRELRPENIVYEENGHGDVVLKLANFGLRINTSMDTSASVIDPFQAPEIIYGRRPTHAADMWSLFATLSDVANLYNPKAYSEYNEAWRSLLTIATTCPEHGELDLRCLRESIIWDKRYRATAAQMLITLYGGAGISTQGEIPMMMSWDTWIAEAGGNLAVEDLFGGTAVALSCLNSDAQAMPLNGRRPSNSQTTLRGAPQPSSEHQSGKSGSLNSTMRLPDDIVDIFTAGALVDLDDCEDITSGPNIREDVETELRRTVESESRFLLEPEIRDKIEAEMRQSVEKQVNQVTEPPIRNTDQPEIAEEMKVQLRKSIEDELRPRIEADVRESLESHITKSVEVRVREELQSGVKRENRDQEAVEMQLRQANEARIAAEAQLKTAIVARDAAERQCREAIEAEKEQYREAKDANTARSKAAAERVVAIEAQLREALEVRDATSAQKAAALKARDASLLQVEEAIDARDASRAQIKDLLEAKKIMDSRLKETAEAKRVIEEQARKALNDKDIIKAHWKKAMKERDSFKAQAQDLAAAREGRASKPQNMVPQAASWIGDPQQHFVDYSLNPLMQERLRLFSGSGDPSDKEKRNLFAPRVPNAPFEQQRKVFVGSADPAIGEWRKRFENPWMTSPSKKRRKAF